MARAVPGHDRPADLRTFLGGPADGAILAAGPDAWASHATAAWLHGFIDSPRPDDFDVLVPRRRHRQIGDLGLHTARSVGIDEVTLVDRIPCTGVARTFLDLASVVSPRILERYLLDQVRRDRGVAARIVDLADRHRSRPGRRRLLDVLARLPHDAARLGSPLEVLGVQRLRELGAPPFMLQYPVRDLDGAPIKRMDVAWPELWTIVEFDGGAYHDLAAVRDDDATARSHARALGWHVEVVRRRDLDDPRFAAFVRRLKAMA